MPGGDPDGFEEAPDRDGLERVAHRNREKDPEHKEHRPRVRFGPGSPGAKASPLSTGGSPRKRASAKRGGGHGRPRAGSDGKASPDGTGKGRRRRGCLIAVVLIIVVTSGVPLAVVSCASNLVDTALYDLDESTYQESSYDRYLDEEYSEIRDAAIGSASQQMETLFSSVISGEEPYVSAAAGSISEEVALWFDRSPEEIGIDPAEIARWAYSLATYEPGETHAWVYSNASGGYDIDCSLYYTVSLPDVDEMVYDLYSRSTDEIDGIYSGDPLTPAERETIRAELEQLMDEPEMRETEIGVWPEGSADTEGRVSAISIDIGEWQEEVGRLI